MDHLSGRLDFLKVGFHIEFEQPLNRALAVEPLAEASLQYLPGRAQMNEKVRARDQLETTPDVRSISAAGQQAQRTQCGEKALVENGDPTRHCRRLPRA